VRKSVLLFASMALTVLLVCGLALAATITCRGTASCFGTNRADTMTGTSADNNMFGKGGDDTMRGRGGADYVRGDQGADVLRGGGAGDTTLWGGGFAAGGDYDDRSDDVVRGGSGPDTIIGGFSRSGVDVLYGDKDNDVVNAAQRSARGVRVTKEIIDCGPGRDTVYFDRGKDVAAKDCEIRREGTASSARLAITAIGADGPGREAAPLSGAEAP
jgi:Ca2+-binding RTX toxin-like protein